MKVYKNGTLIYEGESLYNVMSLVTGITGNLQSNYYDKTETDRLVASASRIIQVSEMPVTPLRNTLYYVGDTIPLDVILVDNDGTQKTLGTTSTDLSQYCLKTEYYDKTASDARYEQTSNKTTSVTSSSTNGEYPSAKAVYDSAISPIVGKNTNGWVVISGTLGSSGAFYCIRNGWAIITATSVKYSDLPYKSNNSLPAVLRPKSRISFTAWAFDKGEIGGACAVEPNGGSSPNMISYWGVPNDSNNIGFSVAYPLID